MNASTFLRSTAAAIFSRSALALLPLDVHERVHLLALHRGRDLLALGLLRDLLVRLRPERAHVGLLLRELLALRGLVGALVRDLLRERVVRLGVPEVLQRVLPLLTLDLGHVALLPERVVHSLLRVFHVLLLLAVLHLPVP